MTLENLDCLIIGGGPAGLTAAIYLARYRRSVVVVDGGHSRAALIPRTRNYPGFADGIAGPELLEALSYQAEHYGVRILRATVETLTTEGDGFTACWQGASARPKRTILATGLVDRKPPISGLDIAVTRGALRYCPICDGYEASDRRIGVIGDVDDACGKALFLRTYSKSVTLVPIGTNRGGDEARRRLLKAGVRLTIGRLAGIEQAPNELIATLSDGAQERFDVIYPILGCDVRSELGAKLGVRHNDAGCLMADSHQRTEVNGLYAIGDVVSDLHQISVAIGHAAIAATAIHNSLPPDLR